MLVVAATVVAEEGNPLSAEVLWKIERVGAPVISPAGGHVVAPVTTYDVESDKSETLLWLLNESGDVQRPLTAKGLTAGNPAFAPDGSKLAFTSRRDDDEAAQIYLLPMDAPGEAQRLTEVPTGVGGIRWAGAHLYFVSSVWPDKDWEEMAEQVKADKDSKLSAHTWNALPYSSWDRWIDEDRQNHLYRIPAAGGEIEALTLPTGWELPRSGAGAGHYDVAPDESLVAFVADSHRDDLDPSPDIFVVEPGSDQARNITPDNEAPDTSPLFSPDGGKLAFTRQLISGFYADTQRLMIHDVEAGETRMVTGDWDRSATGLVWAADSAGLYGAIADEARSRVFLIPVDGADPRPITGETDFGNLSVSGAGTLIANNHSFLYPPRVVKIDPPSGATTRLDTFNDELLAEVDLGRYESVTYEGFGGAEIQMWVHYPPGFDESKTYPLFLLIHGGPHGAISDGFHFRWNAQTFASWGYVTAWHNFHGSPGWGQDFTDAINPDWITAPFNDTIAAAEWFAEQDWIDSDRMVAGGGSYGGYLSSILLAREHPFNALLIHAPVYNMYSQMAADFAVHSTRFGNYWEEPQIYRDISPHYFAEDFHTPALIVHGQNDLRVPVGQAFELFRTLQTKGIESRLIYFPDENHWVLKPNNSVYWYNEVQRWMERFAEPGPR